MAKSSQNQSRNKQDQNFPTQRTRKLPVIWKAVIYFCIIGNFIVSSMKLIICTTLHTKMGTLNTIYKYSNIDDLPLLPLYQGKERVIICLSCLLTPHLLDMNMDLVRLV